LKDFPDQDDVVRLNEVILRPCDPDSRRRVLARQEGSKIKSRIKSKTGVVGLRIGDVQPGCGHT